MNSNFFRIAVLAAMGGMGWWYWNDMQGREEVREEQAQIKSNNQKSYMGEQVHGTQERVEASAAQYEERTKELEKAIEE